MILQGKIAGIILAITGTAVAALIAALGWQTWQLRLCRDVVENTRVELAGVRATNEANAAEMTRIENIRDANRRTFDSAIDSMRAIAAERSIEYHEARAEARQLQVELQNALDLDPTGCGDQPTPRDANRMLDDTGDALPRDGGRPRSAGRP